MGYAAAMALCRLGVDVFLADVQPVSATALQSDFSGLEGTATPMTVDISRSDSVLDLFRTLKDKISGLDMLIHTAGILGETTAIEDLDDTAWRKMMGVNLDGAFYCCREAVRWMKVQQSGRIVLFSSVASLTPTPGALHYSASKGGINMMGKTLAQEVARYNIRVNVIAPGYINTPMLQGLPEGFSDYVIKKTPLRRLGEVEEIAGLVAFLASPESDFFTGQVFSPNGGFVI